MSKASAGNSISNLNNKSTPRKFKFCRTTRKSRSYTKPGLLNIRDKKSKEEWYDYAIARFGVLGEPFLVKQYGDFDAEDASCLKKNVCFSAFIYVSPSFSYLKGGLLRSRISLE